MINLKENKTAIITKYMLIAYQYAGLQSGMFEKYAHVQIYD